MKNWFTRLACLTLLGLWQTREHYQSGRRCRSPPGSWPCLWDLCRGSNEERRAALTWAAGWACTESGKRIDVSRHKKVGGGSSDMSLWSYCGALKKVQDEGDGAAVDAYEEVDARQRDVGCAGDTEYDGQWVHHGRHRPPTGVNDSLQAPQETDYYWLIYLFILINLGKKTGNDKKKHL